MAVVSLFEFDDEIGLPVPEPEEIPDLPRTASETVDVILAFDMGIEGFDSTASDIVDPIFAGWVVDREAEEESAVGVEGFLVPGAEPDLVGVPLSSAPVLAPFGDLNLLVLVVLVGVADLPRVASRDSDFTAAITLSLKILATVASENQSPQ